MIVVWACMCGYSPLLFIVPEKHALGVEGSVWKSSSRTIRNAINRSIFDPCNIACAEILFHSQARNRSTVSLRKLAACESLAASWKQCLDYVTKHAQTQNFPSFCHYPRHQTCHQPCLKCFLFRFHHRHLRTKHSLLICWLTAGRLANGQPCVAEAYRFYRFPKALVMKWMRLRWKVSFCLFQKYAHFIAIFWNYWTPVSKSLFEKCSYVCTKCGSYKANILYTYNIYIIYAPYIHTYINPFEDLA